jgi:hypothetical protein
VGEFLRGGMITPLLNEVGFVWAQDLIIRLFHQPAERVCASVFGKRES